jgi:hypothetical protein
MKALLIAAVAMLLLGACSSEGQFRTSTSFNGRSFQSMDMTDPHFYMNDDAAPSAASPPRVPSAPRYGIDSYCGYCGRGY